MARNKVVSEVYADALRNSIAIEPIAEVHGEWCF